MSKNILQKLKAAESWVVTEDLLESLPTDLAKALQAAAIPHWFNANILSALCPDLSAKSEELYRQLQELSCVEVFTERGHNVHELTRNQLLDYLCLTDSEQFRTLSEKAAEYFAESDRLEMQIEWIYHLVAAYPLKGIKEFTSLIQKWNDTFRRAEIDSLIINFEQQVARLTIANGGIEEVYQEVENNQLQSSKPSQNHPHELTKHDKSRIENKNRLNRNENSYGYGYQSLVTKYSQSDDQLSRDAYERAIEYQRKVESEVVDRIWEDLAAIKQRQSQQGQIDIARQRIEHFTTIIDRRWNSQLRQWIIGSIAILGALTFSTGFQAILKKTDSVFATGGAALVGAGLTYLVDDRATKYLSKRLSRKDAQIAISAIYQQYSTYSPQTAIVKSYFDSQIALVRQVEQEHLMGNDSLDFWAVIGVTVLEAGTAFFIISSTSSLLLALLGGALPVGVIWIAAIFQSDRFEFADVCENLIPVYENYLPPSDEVSEDEMLEILKLEEAVRFLAGNDKYESLAEARFVKEMEFSRQRKAYYEKICIEAIQARQELYKQEVKALPSKFSVPKRSDTLRYIPIGRELDQQQVIERRKQEWIASETRKLEKERDDDIDLISAKYSQKIKTWQARIVSAEETIANL